MTKKLTLFNLSNTAIRFIKEYIFAEMVIDKPIDATILDDITNLAAQWECNMVDENGYDKNYDYPEKQRDIMADKFVTEISGQWTDGVCEPNFDDLNKKLGLI